LCSAGPGKTRSPTCLLLAKLADESAAGSFAANAASSSKCLPTIEPPVCRSAIQSAFSAGQLDELRVTPAGQLEKIRHGRHFAVAGSWLLRQRPGTAKGITIRHDRRRDRLESRHPTRNLGGRYYRIARRSPAWIAHGCLENKRASFTSSSIAWKTFPPCWAICGVQSRDFSLKPFQH